MFKEWKEYYLMKRSGIFDSAYYLLNYPDVRKSDIDPLMHFVKYGWKEGRNPSASFNTSDYLNLYDDVRESGINPVIHFFRHGKKEGRVVNRPNHVEQHKIGIVIVSHNASSAVRVTLASLRQAKNVTPNEVVVVDNASDLLERDVIRNALDRHVREANLPWRYIQLSENRGFSGGNNVGIEMFLKDEAVSHICLLNSDVIVSDFWLDRLLQNKYDVVGPVTNKAASIQSVPIDYELELSDCLNTDKELLYFSAFDKVNKFSQDWFKAWQGNNLLVDKDVTFFCSVISKEIIQKVGLLDTTFFPGGYEDYDYCARVRASSGTICLVRDVFIHHWGSASFGQLSREYFNENALRNRKYLEQKHKIVWTDTPQSPFISYSQDVLYALRGKGERFIQHRFLSLYAKELTNTLTHYCKEFLALQNHVLLSGRVVPQKLESDIALASAQSELLADWNIVVEEINETIEKTAYELSILDTIAQKLGKISDGVYKVATCNINMSNFLFDPDHSVYQTQTSTEKPGLIKVLKKMRKGAIFFWRLKGIVIFGGYPYPERENDGYFQRIRSVDYLFSDQWRVYIDRVDLPGRESWYDRPAPNILVLRVSGTQKRKWLARLCMGLCVLRTGGIYFHSILPMKGVEFLMRLPGITKIIDIHGVVPEEFLYHDDVINAQIFGQLEKIAVKNAHYVIVVTEAMRLHLEEKYGKSIHGKFILLPIFQEITGKRSKKVYGNKKPVVVYAGGLQKWQQVPKMIDAIRKTASSYQYKFFCPKPEEVRAMLPEDLVLNNTIVIGSKPISELLQIYSECHFGFILREDIVVNHVACPTKLVEYIAMGIVPIVDCEDIGDFKSLGMQYVRLQDLLEGRLPKEATRNHMADENYHIYKRLQEINLTGSSALQQVVKFETPSLKYHLRKLDIRIMNWAKHAFPFDTFRGKVARWVFQRSSSIIDIPHRVAGNQPSPINVKEGLNNIPGLLPCDILLQVDNFLAGGLENAVLDIGETLKEAGYRVSLLVLGEAGSAVERARKAGFSVFVTRFEPEAYERLLQTVSPRLVFSHYSLQGAAICAKLKVPLIQMIHNIYMWFSKEQMREFRETVKYTNAFIFPSEFAKTYSTVRLGVPEEKCCNLPYGIDIQSIKNLDFEKVRNSLRVKYQFSDNDFVFLNVSAINHQKNLIGLVKAFHSILEDCPQAKLVLLGPVYEKKLFAEIEKYINQNRLKKQIIYAGESTEAYTYYAMADAFVCASFFEGGPLVFLEALASNLPVVITNVGFASQFSNSKGITLVSPPVDIFEFHGSIRQLNSNVEFENDFAEQLRATYSKRTRPDLAYDLLEMMDKRCVYRLYVDVVNQFFETGKIRPEISEKSWLTQVMGSK